ncbi:MAG TPA: glutamine-hydrolyzing carbamoyl-phosphate synthase small subunit [Methanoregulaceae archaeon]|nr:MAG: glutamine-hydrolyzing carbamoyl-phosphate synthase small subunit [Methanolinea sp.]HON80818.1 glutamine-hydrolyzing carbamoyl-phosphate synthase small subunit [Methanoregulaceae archaeon]HPD09553.1 glutamine-hydrolyzing carbamoyl-phosphate synthase small subunit [Methanoregulaceae archaeon]HRT15224.1 glutamine-hydrolyzing carbamoyl-phosphate synthase small subunit [Methanoregulaceae archaeon]HRU30795.1 glutamine-hydrolyzing carbamoyl-phosphate synthase small subunit [Methanoregulaceae a
MKAVLGLEDGTYVLGDGFGSDGECSGELVFTTQMSGYMEALTDPNYHGQILMFTFPTIGNYGVDRRNFQHPKVWSMGCVAREICQAPEAQPSIMDYFEEQGLLGIQGVDTRMLTIKTRREGTLRAALVVGDDNGAYAVDRARKVTPISDQELIPAVSCRNPYHIKGGGKRIAVIDLGIRKNVILSFKRRNADIHVFPHNTTADQVEGCRPDALFISNGPGDPVRAKDAIRCVSDLAGTLPIYGICMGIQVCCLALGGLTYKMKFGHRGSNQPVRYKDGSVYITTQNHGFAVAADSLPEGCGVLYTNVNDGTLEGFENRYLDITCVQFHPEAHGVPQDSGIPFFDIMFGRL